MACYNPRPVRTSYGYRLDEKTGEIKLTKKIEFIPWQDVDTDTPWDESVTMIPCGKCEGCQVDKANDWATRAALEAQNWHKNAFLTLTYSNEHLPTKRTLQKADLQKFWKRLRKTGEQIRYIACGEYGPKTLRPHYHAIVFNYWPDDAKFYKKNIVGDLLFTSEKLNKIWGLGYVIVGMVSYESAAYVARYVQKKAFGIDKNFNLKHGRAPEFVLTSRRPGISALTFQNSELWKKVLRNEGILIHTKKGVEHKKLPQFLRKMWREKGNTAEYYNWSDKRAREFKTLARARDTSDNYWQQLKKNTEILRQKLKQLDKRNDL